MRFYRFLKWLLSWFEIVLLSIAFLVIAGERLDS